MVTIHRISTTCLQTPILKLNVMVSLTDTNQLSDGTYWGLVCSNILLGFSIFQGYMFYSKYDDKLTLRVFIGFLLSLDISTAFIWAFVMRSFLIYHRGEQNPNHGVVKWCLIMESAMTIIITVSSQLFFARRVYLVTNGRRMIPAIIAMFGFLAIAAGICRILFAMVALDVRSPRIKIATASEGIFAASSDIVATAAMCVKFVDSAFDTGRKRRINAVFRSLFFYTVNCGIIVTSAQIVMVSLNFYSPDSFVWVSIHMCLGRLYVNTLLAMLIARSRWRSKMSQSSIDLASIDVANTGSEKVQVRESEGSHQFTSEITREGAFYLRQQISQL